LRLQAHADKIKSSKMCTGLVISVNPVQCRNLNAQCCIPWNIQAATNAKQVQLRKKCETNTRLRMRNFRNSAWFNPNPNTNLHIRSETIYTVGFGINQYLHLTTFQAEKWSENMQ